MADVSRPQGSPLGTLGSHNLAFVEELYAAYLRDPTSVDPEWRAFFTAFSASSGAEAGGNGNGHAAVRLGPSFSRRSIFNPAGAAAAAPAPAQPSNGGVVRRAEPVVLADEGTAKSRIPFLRNMAIFRELPEEDLTLVASTAQAVSFDEGAFLVREGEVGHDLFIVLEGTAVVRRGGRIVAELGAGEVIGELAVLDRAPRVADVVARTRIRALRVEGAQLQELLGRQPALAHGIIGILSRRLRDTGNRQDRLDQLIRAYRVRGHLIAEVNPLGPPSEEYPELDPGYYGFGPADLDTPFSSQTIPGKTVMTLREIIAHLRRTYCRSLSVQFMHIDDIKVKSWLQERMETSQNEIELSRAEQVRILTKLTDAEIFEQFIHRKFMGAKRFSLEGAESLIPLLDMAIESAGAHGIDEIVIGMAHRGRLNVLANILGKSPRQIFHEFDDSNPDKMMGRGDVKYHLGFSGERITAAGHKVHLSLTFNPSHLEFVGPVVLGRVRAKQDRFGDTERRRGMGIVIHGDAAFAGQGVLQETFNLSELAGYRTGGTLHIIVNNQIGFTTDPHEGRSTQYATDVAKMLQIPILHVNGEHPESVAQAIRLASDFREQFNRDVVIDMYCYRRYGHNEGDEPAFTQPLLYRTIRKRKSVRENYLENLFALGGITADEAERIAVARREALEAELATARSASYESMEISTGQGWWLPYRGGRDSKVPDVDTGVPKTELVELLGKLSGTPEGFTPHPKLERWLESRQKMASGEVPLDWAAAEALAYASLLVDGTRVRLSGQDVGRGTFSHRHAILHDHQTGARFVPLANLSPGQAAFDVFNSPLSEIAVLAFEYGFSLDYPDGLVIWEAQFGDFANVAQVVIDQFIISGEDKWSRLSGLTLLLPHGYEGQGPEHSSARLERFLVLAAEDNIQVVNCSTPAQVFHLLRRQVLRPIRKPLIVMSPKSLLRHPRVSSGLDELTSGTFQRLIPDSSGKVAPEGARKILLTSGKIYYELEKEREDRGAWDVAICRVEQYHPLRMDELERLLAPYREGTPVVWVQEEPRNNGAWGYLELRFGQQIRSRHPFSGVTRRESASPATGSAAAHKKEQALLIEQAFAD